MEEISEGIMGRIEVFRLLSGCVDAAKRFFSSDERVDVVQDIARCCVFKRSATLITKLVFVCYHSNNEGAGS